MSSHVPGVGPGDNLAFVWNIWWAREALAQHINPLHTNYLFYPIGAELAQHTNTALNAVLGATILRYFSPIAAQNVLLLAAVFLNGFVTYLLALRVSGNRFAAAAAGIVFGGAPAVLVRLLGHFNLVGAWAIPAALLLLARGVARTTPAARIAAGLGFAVALYVDYYYFVYALCLSGVYLLTRWVSIRATRSRRKPSLLSRITGGGLALTLSLIVAVAATGGWVLRLGALRVSMLETRNLRTAAWFLAAAWFLSRSRIRLNARLAGRAAADLRGLALTIVTFLIAGSPIIIPSVLLMIRGDYVTQTYLWRSGPPGIDVASFVLGNPLHVAYGALTRRAYSLLGMNLVEGVAWTGLTAACLVALGWRRLREMPAAAPWRAALVVFGIWSLGPWLNVFSTTPGAVLPAILLRYVPVVANARIPGRAAVVLALAVAMLVALTLSFAGRFWSNRKRALVLGLLLVETLPASLPLWAPQPSRVYSYLATQPHGVVLELPLGLRDGLGEIGRFDTKLLYYQTISRKPILGGFVARLSPSVKKRYLDSDILAALLDLSGPSSAPRPATMPPDSRSAYEALARLSIRWVVLNDESDNGSLRDYVARLPLKPVMRDGPRYLFELRKP